MRMGLEATDSCGEDEESPHYAFLCYRNKLAAVSLGLTPCFLVEGERIYGIYFDRSIAHLN
jgi:hypothetical protein